jgi:2,4-diketo-3-deoxy-L-fuconate hydrolase
MTEITDRYAMRFAVSAGRLKVLTEKGGVDVARASEERFAAEPQAVFGVWQEFTEWTSRLPASLPVETIDLASPDIGAPAPSPRQVFAIGLNYRSHAAEANFASPKEPPTFTKFPSSLAGPRGELDLPDGLVDWEVELVVVMGKTAKHVPAQLSSPGRPRGSGTPGSPRGTSRRGTW